MPKIDIAAVPKSHRLGTRLPSSTVSAHLVRAVAWAIRARCRRDFGVNLMTLRLSWPSQRHWHSHEDEVYIMLEGEVKLRRRRRRSVLLRAGECAAFPKGTGNGHHLKNESSAMAIY